MLGADHIDVAEAPDFVETVL
ncbi:hypothetical protein FB33_2603 [Cutibacterium acnes]|nr:hypothetical protein FB33_2603 [Cutibacterium acnes]KEY35285.1 hypothetical protein FB41_0019 [Cutibacterium acnes]